MRKSVKSVDMMPPAGARAAEDGGLSARRLVAEIKSQWLRGEPADARGVLVRYPELGSDKSAVLDLAYEEYCLRRQAGTSPDPDEFCERFPHYKTSLRRLIEAHQCLEAVAPSADDVPAASWPEVGDSFLGFALRRELGRGAFARVFLANDTELGNKWVVVKIARHGAAEAELLGRLDGHPNVVPVLSVKKEDLSGWTAVCMPYLGGATLCDVIDYVFAQPRPRDARVILEAVRRFGPSGEPVPRSAPHYLLRRGTYIDGVLYLAMQLADGLSFVHARGICHGDLKPSNILLAPDGRPLLVDFNLSFDPRQNDRRLGGTLPYMAPEQLQPGAWERGPTPLNVRSDVFAFGVIVYELLTGVYPFGPVRGHGSWAEMRAELLERQRRGCRPVHQLNPRVPHRLARVVGQCLAFAPEDRPRSLDQVRLELRKDLRPHRILGRWVARHPGAVLKMTLGMVLLFSGVAAGLYGPGLWQDHQQRHRLAQARQFIQTGDYTAAIGPLAQFIEVDPANPQGRLLRARAYFRQQKLTEAVADLRAAVPKDQDGRMNAFLGFLIQLQHQPKKAIPYYRAAIDEGFGLAEVYNNLGYCYLRTAHFREASSSLDRAVELDPALPAGYYNRAYLRLMQGVTDDLGDLSRALQDMETAIRLGPQTATLYRHAASLYALAAEVDPVYTDRALGCLGKAVQKGTDPRELAADSYFTILRENPDFQKLIQGPPVPSTPVPEKDLHLADLAPILFADR